VPQGSQRAARTVVIVDQLLGLNRAPVEVALLVDSEPGCGELGGGEALRRVCHRVRLDEDERLHLASGAATCHGARQDGRGSLRATGLPDAQRTLDAGDRLGL
jgi:hypothetical protein